MKKKKNNYGCPKCKVINPDMIMIERWDHIQETAYAIEILIRKVDKEEEYYESYNIKLNKKATNKAFKIETCCDCKSSVEQIHDVIAQELKKKPKKLRKKNVKRNQWQHLKINSHGLFLDIKSSMNARGNTISITMVFGMDGEKMQMKKQKKYIF